MEFFNFLKSPSCFGISMSTEGVSEMGRQKMQDEKRIVKIVNKSGKGEEREKGFVVYEEEKPSAQLFRQQQLINQYMHLNLQLLSQQIETLQQGKKREEGSLEEEEVRVTKKGKRTCTCGHPDRDHYAKGMCSNCYHKYGRNKKPWNCSHQKLYANGMCQNCYINSYNRKKRDNCDVKKEEMDPEY